MNTNINADLPDEPVIKANLTPKERGDWKVEEQGGTVHSQYEPNTDIDYSYEDVYLHPETPYYKCMRCRCIITHDERWNHRQYHNDIDGRLSILQSGPYYTRPIDPRY